MIPLTLAGLRRPGDPRENSVHATHAATGGSPGPRRTPGRRDPNVTSSFLKLRRTSCKVAPQTFKVQPFGGAPHAAPQSPLPGIPVVRLSGATRRLQGLRPRPRNRPCSGVRPGPVGRAVRAGQPPPDRAHGHLAARAPQGPDRGRHAAARLQPDRTQRARVRGPGAFGHDRALRQLHERHQLRHQRARLEVGRRHLRPRPALRRHRQAGLRRPGPHGRGDREGQGGRAARAGGRAGGGDDDRE
ncbi:hypothetical protein Aros01_06582 [Streptosporangium roseum]